MLGSRSGVCGEVSVRRERRSGGAWVGWGWVLLAAGLMMGRAEASPVRMDAVGANDVRMSSMGPDGNPSFGAFLPTVAYNTVARQYLVVWVGEDNSGALVDGEFEIWGRRVDAVTGHALGSEFRISDMGPDGNTGFGAYSVAVAYDPITNQYLVVWGGDDDTPPLVNGEFEIFGQLLSATGTEVGTNDFRISDMGTNGATLPGAGDPAVTFNTATGQYLVVWSGIDGTGTMAADEREIFGQLLSAAGADVGSNDFRISEMGTDGVSNPAVREPAVAYNSVTNQFLVVWGGDDGTAPMVDDEFEIYGQLLTAAGAQTGPDDFRISDLGPDGDANYDASLAKVAYNSTTNQYLVVWTGHDNTAPLVENEVEIFGQLVTAVGGESGTNDFRVSDMGPDGNTAYFGFLPGVAYDAVRNRFLVVWYGSDNTAPLVLDELEIFGQWLTATASEAGVNDFRISDMGPNGATHIAATSPAVAASDALGTFLTVWIADDDAPPLVDNEREIYGQLVGDRITIDSVGDQADQTAGDGVCQTALATCTLRAALEEANATPGQATIGFAVPGSGVKTVQPASALPLITSPVVLDGLTQSGADCSNWPGTLTIDLDGSLAGTSHGLVVQTTDSLIRGLVINRFALNGLRVQNAGTQRNRIQCNYVGTSADGLTASPNQTDGISITNSTSDNIVGTDGDGTEDDEEGNLISGNTGTGVGISGNSHRVAGNWIGVDRTGAARLGNTTSGVGISALSATAVIGTNGDGVSDVQESNVIAANSLFGILVNGSDGHRVAGNWIGTNPAGATGLGNSSAGLQIQGDAQDNWIGASPTGSVSNVTANRIRFNQSQGIRTSGTASTRNSFRGNVIDQNGLLGIDLEGNGVTGNDPNDVDTGSNDRQNFPTILSAVRGPGNVTIDATLNTTAFADVVVDFYASAAPDATGFGEGALWVGSVSTQANAAGVLSFNLPFATAIDADWFITGTATTQAGSTSEFSQAVQATDPTATPTQTATPTRTPTVTATGTPTTTATATSTVTATPTWTASPTATPTSTSSPSATPTSTATWTATSSPSATPTLTATASSTPTRTASATSTATSTPTSTAASTATSTPTASHTASAIPTSTATATWTPTSSQTPTGTVTWTATSAGTATSTPSQTPIASATATNTATATSQAETPTGSPSTTSTATPTGSVLATATSTPTATEAPPSVPAGSGASLVPLVLLLGLIRLARRRSFPRPPIRTGPGGRRPS